MKSDRAMIHAVEPHKIEWYRALEEEINNNKKILLAKGDNRAARIAAAFEIRICCQQLAAYDKKHKREPLHTKDQADVELFLMKHYQFRKIAALDAKQVQYILQKKVSNSAASVDAGSLNYLEKLPIDALFEIAKHLTVEEVGQLASVSIKLRRLVSARSDMAQHYWRRMVARQFPDALQMALLESDKRKTKVGNWYRVFIEAYNRNNEYNKWPLRLRKIVSYIRDEKLEDLKKSGITLADFVFPDPLNSVLCRALRKWGNKEMMDYLFEQVLMPAFALGQDNNHVAQELLVGKTKLTGVTGLTYFAALCNKIDIVMGLSETDEQKINSLCAAVIHKRPAIVRQLLENGARPDVGFPTDEGLMYPVLNTAVINRDVETLKLLLAHGASSNLFLYVNEGSKVRYYWEDKDFVHGATPLFMAARYGYEEIVTALLDHGSAEVNVATEHQETPLQAAAANGNLVIVQSLVARGATINQMYEMQSYEPADFDQIKGRGRTCNTAICNAAMHGHTEVVQFLIAQGADVNRANWKNPSPLVAAIQQGHLATVQALLAAQDIIVKKRHLDLANSCNKPEIAKAIQIHRLEKYIAKLEYEAAHSNRTIKINIFFENTPKMNLKKAKALLRELKGEVPVAAERRNHPAGL